MFGRRAVLVFDRMVQAQPNEWKARGFTDEKVKAFWDKKGPSPDWDKLECMPRKKPCKRCGKTRHSQKNIPTWKGRVAICEKCARELHVLW